MMIYVAVKKEIREGSENLKWLLQPKILRELQRNSAEKLKIIITHIYVPSAKKTLERRQTERDKTEKRLDEYLAMCSNQKVDAEIILHTAENVVKGLVELIDIYQITKLVMGAASDQQYRKNMNMPTSHTACSVSMLAEPSCDIWFVCKGNLVSRRVAALEKVESFESSTDEHSTYNEEKGYRSDSDQSNQLNEALAAEVKILREKLHSESQKNQKLEKEKTEALINVKEFEKKFEAAVKEINYLKDKLSSLSNISVLQNFTEFSSAEIQQATNNNEDKIGKGGFGSVYKGLLRNTMVAVKILNPESSQGIKEFHHEVGILGKVRHPNIVTLMGACSEECTVVYEFLPNGNLAQRLCKKPPLSWQDRIRIADNICSALTFLHSSKPHPIVHGDLKPENILLDANLVSKLGDFGLCRLLKQSSAAGTTVFHLSEKLAGTVPYMAPELLQTGELTKLCDVYSFGVVILQLVTREGPTRSIDVARKAASSNQFDSILGRYAGDWPYQQASKLLVLGLECCNPDGKKRPLLTEVGRRIKDMCVNLS